jgi:hypothetical protein
VKKLDPSFYCISVTHQGCNLGHPFANQLIKSV